MIKITFTDSSIVIVNRIIFDVLLGRFMIGVIYNDGDSPVFQRVEEVEKIEDD